MIATELSRQQALDQFYEKSGFKESVKFCSVDFNPFGTNESKFKQILYIRTPIINLFASVQLTKNADLDK